MPISNRSRCQTFTVEESFEFGMAVLQYIVTQVMIIFLQLHTARLFKITAGTRSSTEQRVSSKASADNDFYYGISVLSAQVLLTPYPISLPLLIRI